MEEQMAAKTGVVNWQSVFKVSLAKLQPAQGARQLPIYPRAQAARDLGTEQAFSDAAAALAALWKLR
jgi:hypothetical protein